MSKENILEAIKNCKKPSVYVDCFGSVGVSKKIIESIGEEIKNEGITN